MADLTKSEALDALEEAWEEFYQDEIDRIDAEVEYLSAVREGISGSSDLRLATIRSAEPFVTLEINNFLEDA